MQESMQVHGIQSPVIQKNIRVDPLIRLGLSPGMCVSEVVSIRTSEIAFYRCLMEIWAEKKD